MTKRKKKKASVKKPASRPRGAVDILRVNWPLLKIYLIFGAVLLVMFAIIMIKSVYTGVVMPFNEFLAWSSVHGLAMLLIDGPLRGLDRDTAYGVGQRLIDMVERGL